jgi:dTDP-glucose 4,6-dehydratase
MNLKGRKILVTGADGFIGSHLTEALVSLGHDVRAFVLYNSFGSWGWLDHADKNVQDSLDIFMGDVRDPNGVRTAMQGCDVVIHLAALIGIPYSYHSPDTYIDTNIKGTLNILQAATPECCQSGTYLYQRSLWYRAIRTDYGATSIARSIALLRQ